MPNIGLIVGTFEAKFSTLCMADELKPGLPIHAGCCSFDRIIEPLQRHKDETESCNFLSKLGHVQCYMKIDKAIIDIHNFVAFHHTGKIYTRKREI